MPSVSVPLAVGGTVMSGLGQIQAGNAAAAQGASLQTASNYSAAVLRQQAGQTMATTEAGIADQANNTAYLLSKVRAQAAGTGGGAADPTILGIEGQIAARGEYDVMSKLYSGQEKAFGMENQADLDVYTGDQQRAEGLAKQQASYMTAAGSVLRESATLYSKYGPDPTTDDARPLRSSDLNSDGPGAFGLRGPI